jgi:ubiquitin-large subunit ribosomal protein L40e
LNYLKRGYRLFHALESRDLTAVSRQKVYLTDSHLRLNTKDECLEMPILDPIKKSIAQKHRLHMKICRDCGARNAATALKCRKCKSKNLRWKKRELVK